MSDTRKILVINGPNLNLLGTREPHIYGRETLADVEARLRSRASQLGCEIDFRQSNHEGDIVGWLHESRGAFHAVLLNPGAFAHYSYAIRDAIVAAEARVIEVHITNIHARDEWRHHLVLAPAAVGVICGLGTLGYELALEAAMTLP